MRKVVLAVFYFLIVLSYAQNKNGSAIVYDKTILMTSQNQNEFLKALKAADSLYVKAGTPLLKTKALCFLLFFIIGQETLVNVLNML